jgi:Ni/Co efflux regulator RcnB
MKTLTIALATVLGIAVAAPITAAQAQETKKVIIKRGHDRDYGRHMGWREHHGGGKKVVIIKHRRHHEM